MQITIKADGKTLYKVELLTLLRIEAIKGRVAVPLPSDGKLGVFLEFGPDDEVSYMKNSIHVETPATLPTDALDD